MLSQRLRALEDDERGHVVGKMAQIPGSHQQRHQQEYRKQQQVAPNEWQHDAEPSSHRADSIEPRSFFERLRDRSEERRVGKECQATWMASCYERDAGKSQTASGRRNPSGVMSA